MTQCNKPKPADLKQALRQVLPGRYEEHQLDKMAQIMMDRARMLKSQRSRIDNRDNRETISDRVPSSSSSSMRNPRSIHLTQGSQEHTSNPPMYIPISSSTSYNPPPGYMINPAYHQAHSVFVPDNNQTKGQSYKRYDNNNKKEKLSEKDYRKRGYATSTSSSSTKKTKQIHLASDDTSLIDYTEEDEVIQTESSPVYQTEEIIESENEEYSECEERSVYDTRRTGYSVTEQANIASNFDRQIVDNSIVQFQPKERYTYEEVDEARKAFTSREISFLSNVIRDQYPGCPHGSSEEQRKDYEQRKVQARRQLIMREHFNRVNNLPQGYFYESEEETEYAST
jgi:hypothetical protein